MNTQAEPADGAQNFHEEPSKAHSTRFTARRIAIFLSIISTILLTANWLVCVTFNYFAGIDGAPAWEFIMPGLSAMFIASMFLGWRFTGLWLRVMYRVAATWLGLLNFAFFASFGAWIFAGVAALFSWHVNPHWIAFAIPASAVLAGIYGIVNASWLRLTPVTVHLKNLPTAWAGRTVALVTDMHLGNVRGANFTRHVVEKLRAAKLDAVCISGDMFDGVEIDADAALAPWKTLTASMPVYYVTGNHEEFEEETKFIQPIMRAGIRVLNNEKIESDGLQIVGIHDGGTDDPATYRALLQRANIDRTRASILLAHQPSNLAIPASEGISLQLSGHTHGGQIWPWHRLAARVHGKYVHGLHPYEAMQVYTSYGAGTWGVPMRVATKSEIILLRLEPMP